ncbi:MAG: GTPase HflX [Methanomassiliicoccales archaeon]
MMGKTCAIVTLDKNLKEIEELASSAGYDIIYVIYQKRSYPDPLTFIGKGKLNELKDITLQRRVDTLLINGELRPSQHYHLENFLKIECIDRIRLVLEIFMLRANDRKSKLQVEKARLRYEIPLLREWIHSAKAGEHPGFLAGGEYAVDVYYDLIRTRIRRIDKELASIHSSEENRRKSRRKDGFILVSFAGYTNAGKSSMMKILTGKEVVIQDEMFSTLTTTTKRMQGTSLPILLTDTIGFIQDLPPYVIEAFKSTLTEIFSADLILYTIDISENLKEVERKIDTSEKILFPEVDSNKIIVILNKIDLLDENKIMNILDFIKNRFPSCEYYFTSTRTGQGIEKLRSAIIRRFAVQNRFEITLPHAEGVESFISSLHEKAEIFEIERSNSIQIKGSCRSIDIMVLTAKVNSLGGKIEFYSSE